MESLTLRCIRARPVLLKLSRELRRETHALGVTGGQASLLWLIRSNPGRGTSIVATLPVDAPAEVRVAVR